jgi:hypothetical protein
MMTMWGWMINDYVHREIFRDTQRKTFEEDFLSWRLPCNFALLLLFALRDCVNDNILTLARNPGADKISGGT